MTASDALNLAKKEEKKTPEKEKADKETKEKFMKLFEGLDLAEAMPAAQSTAEQLKRFVGKYKGQSFTLNIPWTDINTVQQAFHDLHKQTYGHDLDMPVELVNLRVSIKGEVPPFSLPAISAQPVRDELKKVECYGFADPLEVYQREQLVAGQEIAGPALILEKVSTTLVDEKWRCVVDKWGNLLLSRV